MSERTALELRRDRLVDAVEDGTLSHAQVSARLAAIATELEALEQRTQTRVVPAAIDWMAAPADVQRQVAAVLSEVVVLMRDEPTFRATWRNEAWRRPAKAAA